MKSSTYTLPSILLLFLLMGCDESKNIDTSNEKEQLIQRIEQLQLDVINKEKQIKKLEQVQRQSDTEINNEEFYQAIKQLIPKSEISVSLIKERPIQQLKVKVGSHIYFVAWTEDTTASPDLPVVVLFNKDRTPMYAETFGERIESVKYIGSFVLDEGIIEVTSYSGAGSFSGQWVNLLKLNNGTVEDIWEHQTISNESHYLSDQEDVMEYSHRYSTYLIIPSYQRLFAEEKGIAIVVHHSSERILRQDNHEVAREIDTNQFTFIWDEISQKFVNND